MKQQKPDYSVERIAQIELSDAQRLFDQLLNGTISPKQGEKTIARIAPKMVADDYMVWLLTPKTPITTELYYEVYASMLHYASPEFRYQAVPCEHGIAFVFGLMHFERDRSKGEHYIGNRLDFLTRQLWFAKELTNEAYAAGNSVMRCFLGRPKAGLAGIAESYSEVQQLMRCCRFLNHQEQIVDYQQWERRGRTYPSRSDISFLLEAFSRQFSLHNYQEAIDAMTQLLDLCLFGANPPPETLESTICVIIGTVLVTCYRYATEVKTEQMLALRDLIRHCVGEAGYHAEDLRDALLSVLQEYSENPAERNPHQTATGWIQLVKRFVEDHYSNSNLTLELLAEHFHLSPAYISRTFKKKYQCNLSNYIQTLRVQQAEKLLHTDKKLSEIAAQCGFSSVRTMSGIFLKHKHMTPSAYRNCNDSQ